MQSWRLGLPSCLWCGNCNMAGPVVLHSLLRLQMVLHDPHSFQMVLNSLLTKATQCCRNMQPHLQAMLPRLFYWCPLVLHQCPRSLQRSNNSM